MKQRVTLANFRRFVVPEDQYYWMYQDPSIEDIKPEKETSKKESKYGNLQLPKSNDDNNFADK